MRSLIVVLSFAWPAFATPGIITKPDPGSHAERLHALLRHPGMEPGRPRRDGPAKTSKIVRHAVAHFNSGGGRRSTDRLAEKELGALWNKLRPAVRDLYGVDLPPRLRLFAGGGHALDAHALGDGSILIHRSYLEMARSIGRAMARRGSSDAERLRDLASIARAAERGQFRQTFGETDRKTYQRVRDGVLVGVLAHEMGHLVANQPALNFPVRPRPIQQPLRLKKLVDSYLPSAASRAHSLSELAARRAVFVAQTEEADADRVAVDLLARTGGSPDGLMADHLVNAMIDTGTRARELRVHPPNLYRYDDARRRLARRGLSNFSDRIGRADIRRALRNSAR